MANVNEIWLPIPRYDYYEASSLGRIRSIDRVTQNSRGVIKSRKGKVLSLRLSARGYYDFLASIDGVTYHLTVHRAVAAAFHGDVKEKQVNHINGIKIDNRPENLEWCTHLQNIQHSNRTGLVNIKGSRNHMARMVYCGVTGITYSTLRDAANAFNLSTTHICMMLKNKRSNRLNLEYCK